MPPQPRGKPGFTPDEWRKVKIYKGKGCRAPPEQPRLQRRARLLKSVVDDECSNEFWWALPPPWSLKKKAHRAGHITLRAAAS